jgi:probable O-glycosylation ligase (exosortase A-associated)
MRSIYLLLVYIALLGIGASAPFVLTLGYVWLDIFRPQSVAYFLLNGGVPIAMIMGAAAVGGYFALDRQSAPRLSAVTVLTLMLGVWVTLTCLWAEVPEAAWIKWDWAFKTIMFAAFVPYVIRSRIQIEAFLLVFLFSLSANVIPFGAKTILSGGGYGHQLGLVAGNTGLGEGATLATVCLMSIPLILAIRKHSLIIPRNWFTNLGYLGFIAMAILTAIGTFERTALVGLFVLGVTVWITSRRKILVAAVGALIAFGIIFQTSDAWNTRMQTITSGTEDNSIGVRLAVWKWTYNYALDHPLGGGFNVYFIQRIDLPSETSSSGISTIAHRAFHSIYFEVLGEQGWVGLGLFLAIAGLSFLACWGVIRQCRGNPQLLWCGDLAKAIMCAMAILMTCGAFIGIAFQPFLYYTFAITFSLREWVHRVEAEQAPALVPALA